MKEARTRKKRIAFSVRVVSKSLQYDPPFMSGAEGGFCSGVQSLIPERNTILRKKKNHEAFCFQ